MPSLFWSYIVLLLCLVTIDGTYLYFLGGPWFQTQIYAVQRSSLELDPWAAFLCYLLLAALLFHFAFLDRGKLPASEFDAFFFGVAIYGVFECTCKALFHQWTWKTVVLDSVWGGVLFALTLIVSKRILQKSK